LFQPATFHKEPEGRYSTAAIDIPSQDRYLYTTKSNSYGKSRCLSSQSVLIFMRHIFLTLSLLLGSFLYANATSIRGKLLAPAGTNIYLYDYRLHVSDTVGQAQSGTDSLFLMPMPSNAYHGFYRLSWSGGFVDVLYDGEAISFEQLRENDFDILRGGSWRSYRANKERLRRLRSNQDRLEELLSAYEGESRALKVADKQLKKLQKTESKLLKEIRTQASFANRHLRFELPFLSSSRATMAAAYTRENYLNLLDLSDTVQLHYNLVPQLLVAYFQLFEPGDNEDAEVLAISYLNRVFEKLESHPLYFNGVVDFLQIGFQQMGLPKATHLIAQKTATHSACTDPLLRQRLQLGYGKEPSLAPAQTAPALQQLVTTDGTAVSSMSLSSTLLIFWTADCPHCLRDLPSLHLWLKNNHPQLAVTAVSFDTWESSWKAELRQLDGWQHLRDPKGWEGPTANSYLIGATPFFVLIDQKGKIIQTYRSVEALRAALD